MKEVVIRFVTPLLTVAVLAVGCGGGSDSASTSRGRGEPQAIRNITNVLELRGAFNADRGKPRLLLILSPT